MLFPTPYVASLRVYENISSFEALDQERWRNVASRQETMQEEQSKALIRTITGSLPSSNSDGAHIIKVDDNIYVSPWSTAQRFWASLSEFRASMPPNVTRFFFANTVDDSEDNFKFDFDGRVPHVLTETWVIPPRWFSLFEPSDRIVGRNRENATSVSRTTMAMAKQRCIQAHLAVRSAFGIGPVEEEIVQLLKWLNVFNADSLVELDYGGLAQYLDFALRQNGESGIDADTSIEDVWESIRGLSSGDGALAGRGYERLVSRWRQVAAFQQAT